MQAKVNLSLASEIVDEAQAMGINVLHVAEEAVARAAKAERNRRWAEANRGALDAYAAEIEREGLALERHRLF